MGFPDALAALEEYDRFHPIQMTRLSVSLGRQWAFQRYGDILCRSYTTRDLRAIYGGTYYDALEIVSGLDERSGDGDIQSWNLTFSEGFRTQCADPSQDLLELLNSHGPFSP